MDNNSRMCTVKYTKSGQVAELPAFNLEPDPDIHLEYAVACYYSLT